MTKLPRTTKETGLARLIAITREYLTSRQGWLVFLETSSASLVQSHALDTVPIADVLRRNHSPLEMTAEAILASPLGTLARQELHLSSETPFWLVSCD